eukprot:CAMPEP_0171906436 /NCGR_PEP_ID=MMETSP0993-20121228/6074_1 /TAXON_ID=483369 /ORGANISM="non described non described, Strain CCMP2098" /LENGTH=91 /DNA_ID=CAMNT_0012538303 /DNA_START=161 /DNA_END=436 /DNA_ORIENTATION=+
MPKNTVVEISSASTKRLFGLKTVTTAFEYGSVFGLATGLVGGYLLTKTWYSQDMSRSEKASKMSIMALYSTAGLVAFLGTTRLISSIKVKG